MQQQSAAAPDCEATEQTEQTLQTKLNLWTNNSNTNTGIL